MYSVHTRVGEHCARSCHMCAKGKLGATLCCGQQLQASIFKQALRQVKHVFLTACYLKLLRAFLS